jgi:hypothetical protein
MPLFAFTFTVAMDSSSTSSGSAPVLRCLLLFDGTNYYDLVPRMRVHMHGLWLRDFLTGELPCPPRPSAPAHKKLGAIWCSLRHVEVRSGALPPHSAL